MFEKLILSEPDESFARFCPRGLATMAVADAMVEEVINLL